MFSKVEQQSWTSIAVSIVISITFYCNIKSLLITILYAVKTSIFINMELLCIV